MIFKLKIYALLSSLLCLVAANVYSEAATNSDAGQIFKFKFELNKPLVYAVEHKARTVGDVSANNHSSLTRNSTDFRYKIRLTGINTNSDGTTTVFYQPFDFEQDSENVGSAGQIDTTVRGLNLVTKQNGIVTIDTGNGIGMSQAMNAKLPIYPMLLSGYFNFDDTGYARSLDGDLPFIDQWQDNLKYIVGYFHIVFSTNAIPIHGSWTNYLVLKSMAGLFVNGGIILTNVFVRDLDCGTNSCNVSFTYYESNNLSNLNGYVEQQGQRNSVLIPESDESKNATFCFDPKLGQLISMKESEKMENSMNAANGGATIMGHNNTEIENSLTLISP